MNKTLLSLTLAAGLLMSAGAQAQGPAANPTAVPGGAYAVEPGHTQVLFSVLHMGFTNYNGAFSKASGVLKLDPEALSATALDVTVPVASVSTTSAKLDEELRGDQWLDAAKYPDMHLHATTITRTGPSTANIVGELTLHGATRPVMLKARFIGAGVDPLSKAYTVGFQVHGMIKRSEFGVKTYVPLIGDDLDITINAAFVKAPS
jgi:polyisoprenoid-binding protein YceI